MDTIIKLDETRFRTVSAKAQALGKTPEQYVESLIDSDNLTFDQILNPVRQGFDATSDQELDELFERARESARSRATQHEHPRCSSFPLTVIPMGA